MNKKGQAGTFLPYVLIGIVVVLIFAIIVVPIAYTGDQVFDELKTSNQFKDSQESVDRITQVQDLTTPAFDQLVFIILVAIIIGGILIAIFTDYHPAIIGAFVIAIIFLVLISGLFANAYDEVQDIDLLQSKSEEFTYTNTIMGSQFPIIIGIVGVICIVILLAKRGKVMAPA